MPEFWGDLVFEACGALGPKAGFDFFLVALGASSCKYVFSCFLRASFCIAGTPLSWTDSGLQSPVLLLVFVAWCVCFWSAGAFVLVEQVTHAGRLIVCFDCPNYALYFVVLFWAPFRGPKSKNPRATTHC